ncbi:conserved protein of unknown function [Ruminococcaceae bacterium BL-6]|nr:conserved protein of unknown function [Ruminococcaceae bacterium BL-6]
MPIPQIVSFQALDAIKDFEVKFSWQGDQVYGSVLEVYNNASNELVYTNEVTTFLLKNSISANILANGETYYCKLKVKFKDNTYSGYSSPVVFETHKTPILSVNINQNQLIQNANYDVNVNYTSEDNELLNTWVLKLFNNSGVLISNTDIIYATQTMNYTLTGLESGTEYKIQIVGHTVNGFDIESDVVTFQVQYTQPSTFFTVELENQPETGQIRIRSNLISIEGKCNIDPVIYIDGEKVNLTEVDSKVYFDSGFIIPKDSYEIVFLASNFTMYEPIIVLKDEKNSVSIKYMQAIFDNEVGYQAYFLLEAYSGIKNIPYRIVTSPFKLLQDKQKCYIIIKRIKNLYQIDYQIADPWEE